MFLKHALSLGSLLTAAVVYLQPAAAQTPPWLDLNSFLKYSPSVAIDDSFHSDLKYFPPSIRVKIFPHKHTYYPHNRDQDTQRFSIISDTECLVYEGKNDSPTRLDVLLSKSRILHLNANQLQAPLWIECPTPFTLQRAAHLRSFTYSGYLYVKVEYDFQTKKRQLVAVNILPLETYLRGVVPSEVSTDWHMETLKTQAVAARTYAVFHRTYARKYSKHPDFDVDDTIVFQVYTGLNQVEARSDLAIASTTGQILMHGKEIIQAYYHADSGGHTSSASEVFDTHAPYCQSRKEPAIVGHTALRWRRLISADELNEKLLPALNISLFNPITKIFTHEKRMAKGGRVMALSLRLKHGQELDLPISKFKKSFSLNSSMFTVSVMDDGKTFVFDGSGNGHGVGLNQTGAKIMAEKLAWTYEQILNFYYVKTKLCSIELNYMNTATPSCFGDGEWAQEEVKAVKAEQQLL